MKKYLPILLLISSCASLPPIPPIPPEPKPPVTDTVVKIKDTVIYTIIDTLIQKFFKMDTVYLNPDSSLIYGGVLNVKSAGAKGDGVTDDYEILQAACDFCIQNPKICTTVRLPVGNYISSRSILLQNAGRYFTLKITGDVSNKSSSDEYLSKITYDSTAGYAIGIQYGRSIEIDNISITGRYTFPFKVSNQNIGTLKFSDWQDGSVSDSRYKPYTGISIDPDTNKSGTRGGTSDVTIKNCSIKQFMVGIALSPNGVTQNDEMINILEDDIEACRVAIAVCQDQSKTINIKGFKCWASTHTILDGLSYGAGNGGGSVFCENWNIAGNVNELFNMYAGRFPLSCKDIYSESLFRIGQVGQMANFINTQIDFLTGPGMPAADYIISGSPNFYGGMLRYYDNSYTHRLNFVGLNSAFRDMTLNNPPITVGLYGYGSNHYYIPILDNINWYYSFGTDTLIKIQWVPTFIVDRTNWVASFPGSANVGDYILAAPTSTTGKFWDNALNPGQCATIQMGRVTSVSNGIVYLDDVGLNAQSGNNYDAVYVNRLK